MFKYEDALDIARAIVESKRTELSFSDVEEWSPDYLYEWLEAWGYVWVGGGWGALEEEEQSLLRTTILSK